MSLPQHEHRRLVEAALGSVPARSDTLRDDDRVRVEALVARRVGGEPLQYIEGDIPFGPITIAVDPRALIPRPETEFLWEQAVASLGSAGPGTVIVDIGTGSGALALALKHEFPEARVIGIDISEDALALAGENGSRTGLDVEWLHGDLFEPLPPRLRGRIDLIVSNPPYVSESEWPDLPIDVRDHEPRGALVAGPDGTEVLARIGAEAFWWLGVGGWALCEIGSDQAIAALESFSLYDREVRRDLAGRERVLVARKGAPCCV